LQCGVLGLQPAQQFAAGVGIVGQHRAAVHRVDECGERSGPSPDRCASVRIYFRNFKSSRHSQQHAQADVEITSRVGAETARR
jgi:hypothetical protein